MLYITIYQILNDFLNTTIYICELQCVYKCILIDKRIKPYPWVKIYDWKLKRPGLCMQDAEKNCLLPYPLKTVCMRKRYWMMKCSYPRLQSFGIRTYDIQVKDYAGPMFISAAWRNLPEAQSSKLEAGGDESSLVKQSKFIAIADQCWQRAAFWLND